MNYQVTARFTLPISYYRNIGFQFTRLLIAFGRESLSILHTDARNRRAIFH